MEGALQVQEEKKGDVLILRFNGRIDTISAPQAEKLVSERIHEGNHFFVLNLNQVELISSAGLRVLITIAQKLSALSGRVVMSNVPTNVLNVLKLTGFESFIDLVESEEEGVMRLKS